MPRVHNANLLILEAAVDYLGPLVDRMVFLGGCATGLLLTDSGAPPLRVTQDGDVITEVAALRDYHRLAKELRRLGFREDPRPGVPICRWVREEILLDVMPTSPDVLRFGSEWYGHALETAETVELPTGARIRLVTGPCFLATKLTAFDGRGRGD